MRLPSTTTRSLPAIVSYASAAASSSSSSAAASSSRVVAGARASIVAQQQRSFSSSHPTAARRLDGPLPKLTLTQRMLDAGRKALFGGRRERQELQEQGGLTPESFRRLEEDRRRAAALASVDASGDSLLGEEGENTEQDLKMKRLMDRITQKQQKRLARKRWGGSEAKELEHKYSTADFRISPRKLQDLADQINGKPIDYAILQMQFSQKDASSRILSTLALARDHAIAKGMTRSRILVSEAWVGKGAILPRIEWKGRMRTGVRHHRFSRLSVVLRMGKTEEQIKKEKIAKATRIVRSIGHGGVARLHRPDNVVRGPWAY